ncbi:MAG: ribose 5-phosphate isomerase B [Lachnospiraceae bacterium]|nr:ribose 5-phosphate isomerase B [Lachnospiraceae bacterium]MBR5180151.1 ribose 5-phosphate isomerase B [Lachnospiraceae bacterium]
MIAIGSDHAGYALKQEVMAHLKERGEEFKDYGTYSEASCDYPDYAEAVSQAIIKGEADKGILICGTGIGISIAANRHREIRAALCGDCFSAEATRQHNDANVLAMGARVVAGGLALKIVDTFLDTPFSNGANHIRRISKLS